jgi:hypothetical protein
MRLDQAKDAVAGFGSPQVAAEMLGIPQKADTFIGL